MIVPGVILAGGRSSRMGVENKALCLLDGHTLLDHVLDRLQPQLTHVGVNAVEGSLPLAERGLPGLPDVVSGYPGPLAGVLTAMEWARSLGAELVVTVPVDTPFLPGDLVPRLLLAAEATPSGLVLAAGIDNDGTRTIHPAIGIWPVSHATALAEALASGTRKVRQWADSQGAGVAGFLTDRGDPFMNMNSPEDLKLAEAWLRQAG